MGGSVDWISGGSCNEPPYPRIRQFHWTVLCLYNFSLRLIPHKPPTKLDLSPGEDRTCEVLSESWTNAKVMVPPFQGGVHK